MPFSNALLDGFDYDLYYGGGPAPRQAYPAVDTQSFFPTYYPDFNPVDNPDASSRPPFYDPAMSQTTYEGWKEELLDRGVDLAEEYLSNYVGKLTDKLFDKFLIEVYPYSLLHAKSSRLPQLGFWFGDVMRVLPDGKWGVAFENVGDLNAFRRYVDQLATVDHFQVGWCPHGSEDLPDGCEWITYGSPANSLIARAGLGGSAVWLALVGVAVYFGPKLLRGFK